MPLFGQDCATKQQQEYLRIPVTVSSKTCNEGLPFLSSMFETIYLENTENCSLGDHPRFLSLFLSSERTREG